MTLLHVFFTVSYQIGCILGIEGRLGFAKHINLYSGDFAGSGGHLRKEPQAFSHLALIRPAFNLDRVTSGSGGTTKEQSSNIEPWSVAFQIKTSVQCAYDWYAGEFASPVDLTSGP